MIQLQSPGFSRDLHPGEEPAVDDLLRLAFGGTEEVTLVHKLRKSRAIAGEVVLPMGEGIVGYYALSAMRRPKGWLCLAPVAIHPDLQRRGHGRRMIGMLTEWARLTGTPVVVVGEAAFYESAGFRSAPAAGLTSPYPVAHTLLAGLAKPPAPGTELVFAAAFDDLTP